MFMRRFPDNLDFLIAPRIGGRLGGLDLGYRIHCYVTTINRLVPPK